jgi:predicted HicB family RNase H-like nuclease
MKNLMEYKGYFAKIEYSAKDEVFFGTIEGINDTVSFEGTSTAKLKTAFREAVEDYLDMCQRYGKEPQKTYKGSFNVRINPELHKKAAILAASKGTSLNQFVEAAIADRIEQLH